MVIPATERATDHWRPYGDRSMNILRRIIGAVLYALILAGAGALAPAGAQVNTGDPNVIVDLSVLEDAGYGAAPIYAPAAQFYPPASPTGRRLLMPGPENPVSQLHVQPAATADRPAPRPERVPAAMVGPRLYYVIGSFSQWNNAQRLAARHGTLTPSVVTGKLDGRKLFRVVIGPFGPSEQKDMRALIRRSGIYDAWAVRMNSAEWPVARSTGTARN